MFYVVQVSPGMEDRTEILIRGRVESGLYESCFHPMRHVRKKFHGQWKDLHEKLLPGYVFIQSRSIEELYRELQRIPMFTKLLGRDENWFCALREQEVAWLELLLQEEQEAKCSQKAQAVSRETNDATKKRSQGFGGYIRGEETGRNTVSGKSGRDLTDNTVEIGLSQIQADGDAITILSGPLKNMEGYIRKIHLHRRIAEVEVDFMGRKTVIHLGIEMVGKRDF